VERSRRSSASGEDEHRLGLQPILRRVWTPIGEQPIAGVKTQSQWLWLDGFVHPESGENYWWILPYVNTELFNRVLADFAQEFELNRKKRVLLVLDQAGWHISDQLKLPEGLDLYFLLPTDLELNSRSQAAVPSAPAYSPELQPAERLWPLTNEVVANQSPQSIEELEELLMFRCRKLLEQQDLVKGLTCYHWWPMTRAA
jgi:transposase